MRLPDEMQQQAKAIGDPSRFRLFRHIVEAAGPVGVAELTELLGFNHNAIRQHLALLVEAGLVNEANEQRTVRGRPRKEYTPRADALRAFRSVSGSYQRLAELLLTLATTDGGAYEVGFDAASSPSDSDPGSDSDSDSDPGSGSDSGSGSIGGLDGAIRGLERQLAADGFEPVSEGELVTVLGNCPFADLAAGAPGVVCELHRGLIDGYLAGFDGELTGDLTPRDPHEAGCRVVVRRADAD